MNSSLNLTFAERLESLKAGTLSGTSVLLTDLVVLAVNHQAIADLPSLSFNFYLGVQATIAFFSGFLFGVTYRYIIRSDRNPHLQSGAVLAFGLVRGLGELELGLQHSESLWKLAILGGESLLLFGAAQWCLNLAIAGGWIKPFNSDSTPQTLGENGSYSDQ